MEKHEKDTEETGCVSSAKLIKDHHSYLEGQGNKHRRTETNWTEAAARHYRRVEIAVCGTRPLDGVMVQ